MRKRDGITVQGFDRAIDEFFEEMLISPWRRAGVAPWGFEAARVIEHRDRYEVRIAIPGADPDRIEVEVTGQRLSVRALAGPQGRMESAHSFASPIDSEKVAASWSHDTLIVVLPKLQPRRVKVDQQ
jgi:HSP20 family molecular chaperone IbpA